MRKRRSPYLILFLLGAAIAAVFLVLRARGVSGAEDLPRYLENVGRVGVIGDASLVELRSPGASFFFARENAALATALDGQDEEALRDAMRTESIGALVVGAAPTNELESSATVEQRLRAYDGMTLFRCVYLTPRAAIYVVTETFSLDPMLSSALAFTVRALLRGATPPRVQSFPEPFRRIRNVEVLVMLEEDGRPRLWRSARGSSIARGLLTATAVARQRWNERETTMGGPLDLALPHLEVSVYALDEDGTLGARSVPFLERAFSQSHGVAFESRGSWHYLLPEATRERGEGSFARAYQGLFEDADLPADSLGRPDIRLYRALARVLARSPASDGLPSPVEAPSPSAAGSLTTNVVP